MLVLAFSRMSLSLRNIATLAEQISSGDLSVRVAPQSEKDILEAPWRAW